ncbi:MBL fold metallo-hydrolase [Nakamurella lactea]|uniref:MBL fold metallo-hydrolase n=1 Tax=Nakamurella lactea TaxID=459515 RepID=UPI00040661C2|nr:MBL fold metallo-hydrolase [Nakamurella lactea]
MTQRDWTDLTDSVRVCHSALYATASTVVSRPGSNEVLLVDPAWVPSELAGLATDLTDAGLTVAAGFSTHAHHDHLLWHPGFGASPRYASPGATALAERERPALLTALGPGWPTELTDLLGRVSATDTLEPWGELVIHNAHSTGHAALWVPDDRVLLAGDMLSDLELPLLQETGFAAYDAGLTALRPYVERAAIVVPGHGSPTGAPMERWLADRRYLDALAAGTDADDERLANPDMPQAHAANLTAVAESRPAE